MMRLMGKKEFSSRIGDGADDGTHLLRCNIWKSISGLVDLRKGRRI